MNGTPWVQRNDLCSNTLHPVDTSVYTDTDIARFFGALGVPADKVDALIAQRHADTCSHQSFPTPASHR